MTRFEKERDEKKQSVALGHSRKKTEGPWQMQEGARSSTEKGKEEMERIEGTFSSQMLCKDVKTAVADKHNPKEKTWQGRLEGQEQKR
jgi:hypothetical protein